MKTNKNIIFIVAAIVIAILIIKPGGFSLSLAGTPSTLPALVKYANNPVITNGYNNKDPTIIFYQGVYYMAYSYSQGINGLPFVIRMAKSTNLQTWTDMGVILTGNATNWERGSVGAPGLLYDNTTGTFFMYYETIPVGGIGVATTTNINNPTSWVKSTSNPINIGNGGIFDPAPYKQGSTYYLVYECNGVCISSSPNGVTGWSLGTQIITGTGTEAPMIFSFNNTYYILSTYWPQGDNTNWQNIGLFSSSSLTSGWTQSPVLAVTPTAAWEGPNHPTTKTSGGITFAIDSGVGSPQGIVVNNTLVIAYQGSNPVGCPSNCYLGNWNIGIATVKLGYLPQQLVMGASNGGSISPNSGTFPYGSQVTINATPSSGYKFVGWTCNGSGCYAGASATAYIFINASITETANFAAIIPTCSSTQVYNSTQGKCVTPPTPIPICTAPQVYNMTQGKCVTPPQPIPTCISPQILNTTNNMCYTPPVPPVNYGIYGVYIGIAAALRYVILSRKKKR